jgi:predicted unusual protein kinase regulating ubiquinone biosynthesis (AarF/ABC1/UbiB family)
MGVLVAVFVAVNVLVLVALFAAVARRLLGVRFGRVRLLLAGGLGFGVSGPLAGAMGASGARWDGGPGQLWLFVLALALAVLIAMVFLALAEALVPTGSVPTPTGWWRAVRGRVARTRRYLRISGIAVRHGLSPYLRGGRRAALDDPAGRARLAVALRRALDEGGVTFIKLGQVLSTRRDLLPPEFVTELGRLQDDAAPAPWEQVRQLLADELGSPHEEVFAEFDPEPLASASIAQVYAARLPSGDDVVVKVQRPGIRPVVERDLDIVGRLARSLDAGARWARAIGVRELAAGFAAALREELDFRVEAENMAAVAADVGARSVLLPRPYEALCTERVLVMERVTGTPLRSAGALVGLDRRELARRLLDALLRQILVHGVFAARHLGPGGGSSLRMFNDLFRIVTGYGLSVPPELAAVFRALATVEGTIAELAPDLDLVAESRSLAAGYLAEQAGPASLREAVTDELVVLLPMLRRLPRRLDRIAAAAEYGRLGLNVRLFADHRDRRLVTSLLHQVLLTALAATSAVVAVMLLGTPAGPAVTTQVSLYQLLGYNLLVIAAVLAMRVLVLIFRPDP